MSVPAKVFRQVLAQDGWTLASDPLPAPVAAQAPVGQQVQVHESGSMLPPPPFSDEQLFGDTESEADAVSQDFDPLRTAAPPTRQVKDAPQT
jgi:hypothetical protein